jgi:DUF971 family protein
MTNFPTKLERVGEKELEITWGDGQRRRYTFRELRDHCPCATCREKHGKADDQPASLLPVLTPAETQPLRIAGMKPVGNYAYSIAFSDGHDTGIYTFELLRALGRTVE